MFFIHFFALLGIVLMSACFQGIRHNFKAFQKNWLVILFLTALLVRLLAAALSKGFGSDTACFAAWADRIFQVGPGGFYSPDVFTDYPPGYMYVLWLVGAVRKLLGIGYYSVPHLILLKLPAILCDLACGMLLFREAAGKGTKNQAFLLCTAWLFNPAVLLNSSVWGQVDSIYTFFILYMCLCLLHKKTYSTYIAFAISLLIKPQTLMFAPVLLAGIIDQVFLKDFSISKLLHHLFQGLTALGGMLILCLPFGMSNVWNQYFSTVTSYPYTAVNACNFWGLLGLNWISQDNTFLGIPYRIFGWAAILAAVVLLLLLSLRNRKDAEKYPFLGAFLMITIFVFSVRMHERYLYPALLLLLFTYVYKPDWRIFLCYGGFSTLHFYNTAYVLFFYDPANYDRKSPIILLVSAGMLVFSGLFYNLTCRLYWRTDAVQLDWSMTTERGIGGQASLKQRIDRAEHSSKEWTGHEQDTGSMTKEPQDTDSSKQTRCTKVDLVCMAVFTLIYSCFALYDLGDRQAPSTHLDLVQNQSITLDFGSDVPETLSYYIAPWHNRAFTLEAKNSSGTTWINFGEIKLENVFTWQDVTLGTGLTQLRLTLRETQASLLEFTFLDAEGNCLTPVNAGDYPALFDESDLHPEAQSFRNSMYFDEIYHGRTAYEFINGLTSYENTHPPLGKILISVGVRLFGMNPFGWRIIGTLFGIAMIPFLYLFAKKISKSTLLAALACGLFTFDFMHFAQTRIATIDVYVTFFVILMYYFMYQYSQLDFYDASLKKQLLPLGACGVSMGLGIACKWTGVYAGAGLAVIFFAHLYRSYREYLLAREHPSGRTRGISNRTILKSFLPNTKRTILFCLVFFVAIPALIYLLSYLPFRDYSDRGLVSRMLANQQTMFSYHSSLDSTHPYSSSWYEWPIIKRPIWFYSRIVTQTAEGGLREGISSFGNPAVWWMGIPATFYMVYLWLKKKDRTAAFLVVGYLAQYLPWFFVTRITFIYHYFPSVIFVVLMIMYSMQQWKNRLSKPIFVTMVVLYLAVVFGLFLLFYPVLSGQPVEAAFVTKYLRWFNTWVLTSK